MCTNVYTNLTLNQIVRTSRSLTCNRKVMVNSRVTAQSDVPLRFVVTSVLSRSISINFICRIVGILIRYTGHNASD